MRDQLLKCEKDICLRNTTSHNKYQVCGSTLARVVNILFLHPWSLGNTMITLLGQKHNIPIHSDMVPCSFESLGHYYILHRCPSNPLSIYISIDNIVVWRYWYRFVAKSCPTLSDPMDCSLPGYSVHGISQARILEWVSISFSRGSSQPRDQTCISCLAGGFFTTGATRKA